MDSRYPLALVWNFHSVQTITLYIRISGRAQPRGLLSNHHPVDIKEICPKHNYKFCRIQKYWFFTLYPLRATTVRSQGPLILNKWPSRDWINRKIFRYTADPHPTCEFWALSSGHTRVWSIEIVKVCSDTFYLVRQTTFTKLFWLRVGTLLRNRFICLSKSLCSKINYRRILSEMRTGNGWRDFKSQIGKDALKKWA